MPPAGSFPVSCRRFVPHRERPDAARRSSDASAPNNPLQWRRGRTASETVPAGRAARHEIRLDPRSPRDVYRTKPHTFAPRDTRSSTRWLPMNRAVPRRGRGGALHRIRGRGPQLLGSRLQHGGTLPLVVAAAVALRVTSALCGSLPPGDNVGANQYSITCRFGTIEA